MGLNSRKTHPSAVGRRGFTLIELMIVVVIMGVLAALGAVAFRGQLSQAKNTEALAMARSIGAAQEAYRAENRTYLNVSNSLTSYYPTASPDETQRTFWGHSSGAQYNRWVLLAPKAPQSVRFGYAVVAGRPRATAPSGIAVTYTWPAPATITGPWYVMQAIGDVDGDGDQSTIVLSSFSNQVFQLRAGE